MTTKLKTEYRVPALILSFVLLLILVLVISTKCGSSAERIWLKAPDWSRAQIINASRINDPASIVIDDDETIYVVSITSDDEISRPRIIALKPNAEPLWDATLDFTIDRPDKPRLVWANPNLYIFWLDANRLYATKTDNAGILLEQPVLVSGDHFVESYSVDANTSGEVSVWYAGSRRTPGLYSLTLGGAGTEPALVDLLGIRPSIQYDLEDRLHAAWGQHPPGFGDNKILYASYPDGEFSFGREEIIAQPIIAPTSLLQGPYFGMDKTHSTIIWSIEVRTGMEAGSTETSYVSFPNSEPEKASTPALLLVPATVLEDYVHVSDSGLKAGRRISLEEGWGAGTSSIRDIATNKKNVDELLITYSSTLPHMWRKAASQVNLLFFRDGKPRHYQLLSFTRSPSSSPAVVSDREGYLDITWIESAAEGFSIYFAGTSPAVDATLSSLTWNDVRLLTGETVFGLLSGIVVAPIAVLLWMVIPLFVLFLTGMIRRGNDNFSNPATIVSVVLTVVVYLAIKAGTTPEFGVYVPFSAWLPIAEWLQTPLQYIVPVAITLFALFATWYFAYRRGTLSLLYLTMIFIAIDGTLTMSLYGILFLGAL